MVDYAGIHQFYEYLKIHLFIQIFFKYFSVETLPYPPCFIVNFV